METYNQNKEAYLRSLFDTHYVFEVTKCCGYSSWVSVYKDEPYSTLYKNIMREFNYLQLSQPKVDFQLYATNVLGEKLILPKAFDDEHHYIKDFLSKNKEFFIPVYPLPAKIVYKIYLDDGHTHS
jgi:hypothetical protein